MEDDIIKKIAKLIDEADNPDDLNSDDPRLNWNLESGDLEDKDVFGPELTSSQIISQLFMEPNATIGVVGSMQEALERIDAWAYSLDYFLPTDLIDDAKKIVINHWAHWQRLGKVPIPLACPEDLEEAE